MAKIVYSNVSKLLLIFSEFISIVSTQSTIIISIQHSAYPNPNSNARQSREVHFVIIFWLLSQKYTKNITKIHNTTTEAVDLTRINYNTHMTSPHVINNNPNESERIYAKPCTYTYPWTTRTPYLHRYTTDMIPCPTSHIRLFIQYS